MSKPDKRNQARIAAAIMAAGLHLKYATWTPIGIAFEMCGPSGGWEVDTEEGLMFHAYNVGDLLKNIVARNSD